MSIGGHWQPPDRDPIEGIDTQFKTGDIVTVKSDYDLRHIENRNSVVHGMFYLNGKEFVISDVDIISWYKTCYKLQEINADGLQERILCCFTYDMLIPIMEPKWGRFNSGPQLAEKLIASCEFDEDLL